jgi:alpha-galactosidase
MQQHVVLIGAGSANFGLGTLGDLFKSKYFEGSRITLVDINPDALRRVEEIARRHIGMHRLPYELRATTNREEALQGATFCIISIEVGNRFELWDQDWRVPQSFGIPVVNGENGGPGGLFHALRIVPPILDICADIDRICPEAHVFNFSNPMIRICTTVKRKYPDLRFTGLCHEAGSLQHALPAILSTQLENLVYLSGGLNHFGALLEVHYRDSGKDAYPDVRAKAPDYYDHIPYELDWALEGLPDAVRRTFRGQTPWDGRGVIRVVLEEFGVLPITSDSHMGEFIHWAPEVADHQGILDFIRGYRLWTANQVTPERVEGTHEGWTLQAILDGIMSDSGHEEIAVNLINAGLIDNLPADIVVEVPGIVDRNGVRGKPVGRIPSGFAGLLHNQYAAHDLCAEAILTRSKQAVLQAMLVDPIVPSVRAAKQTLDAMLVLQKSYLEYLE